LRWNGKTKRIRKDTITLNNHIYYYMISIVKIMEGESNTDKFTFKQKDAGGVRPSYQNTKVLKQLGIMKFAVTDLC